MTHDDDSASREGAVAKLKVPAIILLVTAALGAVAAVGSLLMAETVRGPALQDPNLDEQTRQTVEFMFGTGAWLLHGWSFVASAVCVAGALAMLNVRSRGLAITAAILVMLIPSGCCCVVGLVPGIWSLAILFRPETVAAFAARR